MTKPRSFKILFQGLTLTHSFSWSVKAGELAPVSSLEFTDLAADQVLVNGALSVVNEKKHEKTSLQILTFFVM